MTDERPTSLHTHRSRRRDHDRSHLPASASELTQTDVRPPCPVLLPMAPHVNESAADTAWQLAGLTAKQAGQRTKSLPLRAGRDERAGRQGCIDRGLGVGGWRSGAGSWVRAECARATRWWWGLARAHGETGQNARARGRHESRPTGTASGATPVAAARCMPYSYSGHPPRGPPPLASRDFSSLRFDLPGRQRACQRWSGCWNHTRFPWHGHGKDSF